MTSVFQACFMQSRDVIPWTLPLVSGQVNNRDWAHVNLVSDIGIQYIWKGVVYVHFKVILCHGSARSREAKEKNALFLYYFHLSIFFWLSCTSLSSCLSPRRFVLFLLTSGNCNFILQRIPTYNGSFHNNYNKSTKTLSISVRGQSNFCLFWAAPISPAAPLLWLFLFFLFFSSNWKS